MIRVHTFYGNWNDDAPIDERIKDTHEDHEPHEYERWQRRFSDQGFVIESKPPLYRGQLRRIHAYHRQLEETAHYFATSL